MSDYQPLINPKGRGRSQDKQGFSDEFQTRFEAPEFAVSTPVSIPVTAAVTPETQPAEKKKRDRLENVQHFLKRGHFISFVGLLLFTVFVYFRPYEYSA